MNPSRTVRAPRIAALAAPALVAALLGAALSAPGAAAAAVAAASHLRDDVRSDHALRVVSLFAQMVLVEDLDVRADLVLVERVDPRRGNVLALRSPVRTIREEAYRPTRPRDLDDPAAVARRFVDAAVLARVLEPLAARRGAAPASAPDPRRDGSPAAT